MFKKILIANRGEIACRVIKTARKMGIATVAVYSDADRNARHVALADEAVRLGPPPSRESYLLGDAVIAACKATGAEAVHPGYGFLSENAEFARKAEAAGIVFIGPKHEAIAAMGDKIASKKLAQQAGVNVIPGVNEAIADAAQAVQIARDIGYPVMVKASAGGGGKGLRVACDDRQAAEGFESCRSEARNSFGDDRVFIEKFVEQPRHIEIQVLGDSQGNLIFLNERECSIQRRHQKVIEEAPSPFISDDTRQRMGAQAVQLARAVNYQSAGTVEFVVGKDQSFYFLEMNTRLQVEHPVTECITGLDLVELMIRVAAGESLPLSQAQVRRDGWAIECRINAEDPFRGFLPSTGRLVRFEPPPTTLHAAEPMPREAYGVRVDTGVEEGGEIPMQYDSMIAKLIVHGRDRQDALIRMRDALNAFVIRGISSNIPLQAALLAHPKVLAGDFDTGFIGEHFADGLPADGVPHEDPLFLVALAAFVRRKARERSAGISGQLPGHGVVALPDLVVVVLDPLQGRQVHHGVHVQSFDADLGQADLRIGSRRYVIDSKSRLGGVLIEGFCNGRAFAAQIERSDPTKQRRNPLAIRISHNGARIDTLVLLPRAAELLKLMPHKAPPDLSKLLLSPMPGLLAQLLVKAGQPVRAGERLAVIEAMKMENILTAINDGTVAEVLAEQGQSLSVDQPILSFQ